MQTDLFVDEFVDSDEETMLIVCCADPHQMTFLYADDDVDVLADDLDVDAVDDPVDDDAVEVDDPVEVDDVENVDVEAIEDVDVDGACT